MFMVRLSTTCLRQRFFATNHGLLAMILVFGLAACGGGGSSRLAATPPDTAEVPPPAVSPPPDTTEPPPPVAPPPPDTYEPLPPDVVHTSAFIPTSEFADVMRGCTYAGDDTEECKLSTLPFIGQSNTNPTIDDVMAQVLVSHTWMGENLRAALNDLPDDLLLLMRSVTAVVIASDVRPPHYNPNTGAIYLDPNVLWLTQAERDTVSDEVDSRDDFGDELQFAFPAHLAQARQAVALSLNSDASRELSALLPFIAFLLYHELAHAVDFMPSEHIVNLADSQTALEAILSNAFLSSTWSEANPLSSDILRGLAAVSFLGETATEVQKATTPEELVPEFTGDGAIQYYSYISQFEDFATLFDTVMMQYHFGFVKDVAITTNADNPWDGIVAWGQHARLGDQATNDRARQVIAALYPGELAEVERFLAALPAPLPLAEGVPWGEGRVGGTEGASQRADMEIRRADDILSRRSIR